LRRSIGGGATQVEAVSTGKTSHRGAYATAAPHRKVWFDCDNAGAIKK
jgi:hypothetical protein